MRINSVESPISLVIDHKSGLPSSITKKIEDKTVTQELVCSLEIEINGSEKRAPTGGIEYFDTRTFKDTAIQGEVREISSHHAAIFELPVRVGEIELSLIYSLNTHGPALSIAARFSNQKEVIVRNLVLRVEIKNIDEKSILNIPGNGLRSNLTVSTLTESAGISPLGGLRGSSSTIHLSDSINSFVTWIDNDVEIPESEVVYKDSDLQIKMTSNFASDLEEISSLDVQLMSFDIHRGTWRNFPAIFDTWLRTRGIASPANPPAWVKPAMIFETQIGFSVFAKVNHYSPYPEVENLIDDLDRIKNLGFTCIQLMPRQPYPSYNVHDYWDIDTSYGKESEIRRLVQEAHKRGIKVIFDVLLHGILDKEIIKTAADGVRSGPFSSLIEAKTEDSFSADVKDWHNYLIAWSRHIIDFEPYWSDGSPTKTELEDSHPDWFYRFTSGEIAGVYTKAFDARNSEWQEYFTNAMMNLVEKLDIDGFRFDAPTYNDFHNWAPWARYRAGASALACTGLFEKMRPIFKARKPDFLFYTEPSGLSLRRSMDLNYNYDEQWLVTALANPDTRKPWGISSAKDLASWICDRDSVLPHGSMTAHHIDSHDTFWWPSWGAKWRREQFGLQFVRLLTSMFGLLPGPFMMFIGGEEGIEDLLPQIAQIKSSEVWSLGKPHWWLSSCTPEDVFGLTHHHEKRAISLLINVSDRVSRFDSEIPLESVELLMEEGNFAFSENILELAPRSAIVLAHDWM
jgi:Alpha amylase, catalytic domain